MIYRYNSLNNIFPIDKIRTVILVTTALTQFACTQKSNDDLFTYVVKRADYVEKIYVPGTVQAVSNQPVVAPRNISGGQLTVSSIAEDGAFVRKGDTLCVVSNPETESLYRDGLTSIERLEAELKKAEAENKVNIANLQAKLESEEGKLRIAFLDTLKIAYAPGFQQQLIRLGVKKNLIEKEKIEKQLSNARKIGETDLRQKRARIIQEKMRVQSYLNQLNSFKIVAQRDGVVIRAETPKVTIMSSMGSGVFGGRVREGSILFFDLTVLKFPDLSRMQISADVGEADFKRIEKGQKAIISIDASGQIITTGRVNRKSLAMSPEQRYSDSKVRTYEVIIDVDSCHTKLKPGLSAGCEIILKEIKDTLFVPNPAVFKKDSSSIVYVKMMKKYQPLQVETGLTGDTYTIIASGLREDEVIALTEPGRRLLKRINTVAR